MYKVEIGTSEYVLYLGPEDISTISVRTFQLPVGKWVFKLKITDARKIWYTAEFGVTINVVSPSQTELQESLAQLTTTYAPITTQPTKTPITRTPTIVGQTPSPTTTTLSPTLKPTYAPTEPCLYRDYIEAMLKQTSGVNLVLLFLFVCLFACLLILFCVIFYFSYFGCSNH